jgi:RHS repeat-associated protein
LAVPSCGALVANYTYSPYGATSASSSANTPFQYTGRENDGDANLYYYRARYYSPTLNRFISGDPLGLSGGMNFYAYAGGNPISFGDPLGLTWVPPSIPDGVANSVTGFGDGVYRGLTFGFGDLNAFRNAIGIYGGFDPCSYGYGAGKNVGVAWAIATMWAAGLNGGANSVFWSGRGAAKLAVESGLMPIQHTAIGSLLNAAGVESRFIWSLASATYAANASGTATAYITYFNPEAIWTLEQAILELRGVPFRVL